MGNCTNAADIKNNVLSIGTQYTEDEKNTENSLRAIYVCAKQMKEGDRFFTGSPYIHFGILFYFEIENDKLRFAHIGVGENKQIELDYDIPSYDLLCELKLAGEISINFTFSLSDVQKIMSSFNINGIDHIYSMADHAYYINNRFLFTRPTHSRINSVYNSQMNVNFVRKVLYKFLGKSQNIDSFIKKIDSIVNINDLQDLIQIDEFTTDTA